MLEKLKLVKALVKRGISYNEFRFNIMPILIELNDPELACLFINSTNDISFVDLQSLINIVKNNAEVGNGKWIDILIVILNNKPNVIKYEFMNEINELDYIKYHSLNNKSVKTM